MLKDRIFAVLCFSFLFITSATSVEAKDALSCECQCAPGDFDLLSE